MSMRPEFLRIERWIGFALVVGIWIAVSALELLHPLFLPSPWVVMASALRLVESGALPGAILASFLRIFMGFWLAIAVSIPLGLWIGANKTVSKVLSPVVSFVRYIPPSAFLALSLIWFGVGEPQKYFMVFVFTAPYLTMLVADAVKAVPEKIVSSARVFGVQGAQLYTRVLLPYSMPRIWDAIRLMLGAAWNAIILVELVAVSSGLGAILIRSQRFLQMGDVFAILVLLGFIGLGLDFLMLRLRQYLFAWDQVSFK